MTSAPQDTLPLSVAAASTPDPVEFAAPVEGPTRYDVVLSPIGDLLLTSDGVSLTGLHVGPEEGRSPSPEPTWHHDPGVFGQVRKQLDSYFAGELREFDVPLAPSGTAFQLSAWRALTTVGYGRTASYGEIAAALGRQGAARAVGMANNRNPISIIVPCHRVVGANGKLVGYGGGVSRKEYLLRLESGAQR
ncbi:methylated-DNA-[protein]-cysteine S-methyltransferase [Haloactinospora alba]|uniref:Methylated-DNA--protein-cysteine methyltransferase n=1 Tax=Haloactinospora alba TaxID=405555 RepID=A0A543NMD7_9ACTN|nr:methylated-DNA--[protein]-cysteine S-methyltransferase [Haloactinospora alba]TQN32964.1 methylated-DNA-[protein]-cysteine S-methyltransferase [Haloactinospora alba]